MPHIHTAPGQHDLTASGFIVRLDLPEPVLLLHMHKKLGKYLQFGGHVELHENPWQAVTHELAEESGYTIDQLRILQPPVRIQSFSDAQLHPYPVYLQTHRFADTDHFHTDIAYAFVANVPPAHAVKAGESEDLQTFTADQLLALTRDQIPDNVKQTGLFVLEECLTRWQAIDTANFS